MGEKHKQPGEKQRGKKKLELKKETIQELSEGELDKVAGGVTGGCATGEGAQRGIGPTGPTGARADATCSETVP
jgi:hypothetical protein